MDGGGTSRWNGGEDDGVPVTGRLRDLPERGDPVVPGLACGRGWVALMYARGRMTTAQLAAAVDIGRGVTDAATASIGCGLRAVDPSRLVVDGGNRTSPPVAPRGGKLAASPSAARFVQWRAEVLASGKPGLLRGRWEVLYLDVAVTRVILGEVEPRALDEQLGLRNGRVSEAVLRSLVVYEERFGLIVQKNSS